MIGVAAGPMASGCLRAAVREIGVVHQLWVLLWLNEAATCSNCYRKPSQTLDMWLLSVIGWDDTS